MKIAIVAAVTAFSSAVGGYFLCAMMAVGKRSDEQSDRLLDNLKRGKESNMSNMSYCRFENTGPDVVDCTDAIQEAIDEGKTIEQFRADLSSDNERRAFDRLRDYCQNFVDAYNDLGGQGHG